MCAARVCRGGEICSGGCLRGIGGRVALALALNWSRVGGVG
jgi:hypothetical protein